MYLLIISYIEPLATVEPHMKPHGAWVKQHLDAGEFLFAGPKKSGLGGVIAARSMDRAALQKLLATDAYVEAGVAEYQVVEFDNRLARAGLEALNAA
jgi:uncharacterized protein YciI